VTSDVGRYGRSFADVYDAWYADAPADGLVAFVAARAPTGADVLELGVGTGRVALPLADAGFRVAGIDASAEMLDRLAAKPGSERVTARLADAADVDAYPPASADVVLAVFNLLFNLTGPDDQARCLLGCARALRPGGRLIVEAFVPDVVVERRTDLVTRSVDDGGVVLIATDADPATQIVHGSHIEITEHGTRLRPWRVKVATPDALDALAAAAGLTLDERHEDVDETPFVEGESTHHVSVYLKEP